MFLICHQRYQNVVKSWWSRQDACTPCVHAAYCGTWLCKDTACRRTEAPCRTLAACVAADCRDTCSCGRSPRSGAPATCSTHLLLLPIQYVTYVTGLYMLNINWVFPLSGNLSSSLEIARRISFGVNYPRK